MFLYSLSFFCAVNVYQHVDMVEASLDQSGNCEKFFCCSFMRSDSSCKFEW